MSGRHSYLGRNGNSRGQRLRSKLGDAITLDRLNRLLAFPTSTSMEHNMIPKTLVVDVFEGLPIEHMPNLLQRLLPADRRVVCGLALELLRAGTPRQAFAQKMLAALGHLAEDAPADPERGRLHALLRAVTQHMSSLEDLVRRLSALRAEAIARERILQMWPPDEAEVPGQ